MPSTVRVFLLVLPFVFFAPVVSAETPQDCQLKILHSAIGDTHSFNLKVSCRGNYTPLTYLLRARRTVNGVTLTDSQTGTFNIHGDSRTVGDIQVDMAPGDAITLEGKILQACEVLGDTRLAFSK